MGYHATLRKLAVRDDRFVAALLADEPLPDGVVELDRRTQALIRLGALIALDAAAPSYMSAVEEAVGGGATIEEIVEALIVVLPVVGVARVVSAAPNLGLAVGYDVAEALERLEESRL